MRFRVALVLALALATVTACGRGKESKPAVQQRPAAPAPTTPRPDSARLAAARRAAAESAQARARPAPDTTKKPAPAARPAGKFYTVQIGAFVNADSARSWTGRLASQGLPVWTTTFQLHGRTFHRVRVGVVRSVAEARKLGDMLKQRYSWSFWVAPVSDADAVPDGAVQATQRILSG